MTKIHDCTTLEGKKKLNSEKFPDGDVLLTVREFPGGNNEVGVYVIDSNEHDGMLMRGSFQDKNDAVFFAGVLGVGMYAEEPLGKRRLIEAVKGRKYISPKEFAELGLLHEANRQFLHPLGLALEMSCDEDNPEDWWFSGVWDSREDPDGIVFDELDSNKQKKAADFIRERHTMRSTSLGFVVQTADMPKI
jgi:hypothetical protein